MHIINIYSLHIFLIYRPIPFMHTLDEYTLHEYILDDISTNEVPSNILNPLIIRMFLTLKNFVFYIY